MISDTQVASTLYLEISLWNSRRTTFMACSVRMVQARAPCSTSSADCSASNKVPFSWMAFRHKIAELLKDIFMVPEEFELPNVSLATYVKMNQGFYPNFSQEVLDRCLKVFDLPLSLKLNELSMGQKKKVFMSFALATGTRFLLMDEPTNGLDIPSKSQFRKVIANNMTEDRTLIISTHQVHDVESLLDHIIIMNQSQLLLDTSVSDICEKYTFEYRNPQEMDDTVLYAEPTLQGNAAICKRQEGEQETQMNLELLFNAVINKKLND